MTYILHFLTRLFFSKLCKYMYSACYPSVQVQKYCNVCLVCKNRMQSLAGRITKTWLMLTEIFETNIIIYSPRKCFKNVVLVNHYLMTYICNIDCILCSQFETLAIKSVFSNPWSVDDHDIFLCGAFSLPLDIYTYLPSFIVLVLR